MSLMIGRLTTHCYRLFFGMLSLCGAERSESLTGKNITATAYLPLGKYE